MNFHKILAFVIFIAILPLPYGFYLVLRPLVCLGVIYLLVRDWKALDSNHKAILVIIAALFNPVAAIYLSKLIWVPIDILCGYYFLKRYPLTRN
jgi:hypothetical protein